MTTDKILAIAFGALSGVASAILAFLGCVKLCRRKKSEKDP